MNFKDFLSRQAKPKSHAGQQSGEKSLSIVERWHELLHHIAAEEMAACNVYEVAARGDSGVDFFADCQDIPREEGYQPDLSRKVQERLKLHPLQRLNTLKVRVFHQNQDEFSLERGAEPATLVMD